MVVKIGFVKLGNVGSSPIIELLLDERADREDIDIRCIGTGAKLGVEQSEEATRKILEFNPSLVIISSPNAALPGPAKAREILGNSNIPTIVVSDAPAKKVLKSLSEKGFGYIIIEADAMIGARREFLDPVEMSIFNGEIIKVLAITGAFNVLFTEIDKVIETIKRNEKPNLPQIVVDKDVAVNAAKFGNPYTKAKAMAAYEMLRKVAELDSEGCFKLQEREKYVPVVTAAHELLRVASKLADEAREIEKESDSLTRMPHHKDGTILLKKKLDEKPVRI